MQVFKVFKNRTKMTGVYFLYSSLFFSAPMPLELIEPKNNSSIKENNSFEEYVAT